MRTSFRQVLLFAVLGTSSLAVAIYVVIYLSTWMWESPEFVKYKQIHEGMSVQEVQAILEPTLGPGTPVNQADVPTDEVLVNPKDAELLREKARRPGQATVTHVDDRDRFPTRRQPVVEGDFILRWAPTGPGATYGVQIYVAFRNGKVCGKYYKDLNYL
jgi:hypothetical protein